MDDFELLNLLTDMVRAHTAHIDHQLSYLGLSNGQGGVISALGRCGTLTQNDLARFRKVTPATISIMLARMERDGIVTRTVSPSNGRATSVSLTDYGRELYEKLVESMQSEPAEILAGLTKEEKEQAAYIFNKVKDNLTTSMQ